MSGGVDSSTAAALLLDAGYEVEGAFMLLPPMETIREFLQQDIDDAKKVANELHIPLHILNFQEEFQKLVIGRFTQEYLQGATPNPCVFCNPSVKFGLFLEWALDHDFDYVATGHYAKVHKNEEGRYQLQKARDQKKDQTYFMNRLTQHMLSHVLFPLGDLTKEEVRKLGGDKHIAVASKSDSEEICFVRGESHGEFIERQVNTDALKGNFVDENGKILGPHKGIHHYTLGQRRGLGIATGSRVFVTKIDPVTKDITLAGRDALLKTKIKVASVNWMAFEDLPHPMTVDVKIRHTTKASKARIEKLSDEEGSMILVSFEKPVWAPARGQSAVFYDGDLMVGGGYIAQVVE